MDLLAEEINCSFHMLFQAKIPSLTLSNEDDLQAFGCLSPQEEASPARPGSFQGLVSHR